MSDRAWAAFLVYPAPLYVGLLVLAHFGDGGWALPVGFFVVLGFGSLTGFGVLRHPAGVWAGRMVLILACLVPIDLGVSVGATTLDFAAGILIGAPFLWLEYAWRDTPPPGSRVIALQSALFFGILELAAISGSSSVAGGGGNQFLLSVGQVLGSQAAGIVALLTGTAPASLPLESAFDGVYVALGAIALAAVLFSWVAPRTALDEPLPWSWVRVPPPAAEELPLAEELGLRPGQRAAVASRTLPAPPKAMLVPGLVPIAGTSLLVAGFLLLAVTAPTYALLALALGTVSAIGGVLVVLHRRLTPLGGLSA